MLPPKAHPQRVVLGMLRSELVVRSAGMVTGKEVEQALLAQNRSALEALLDSPPATEDQD